MCTYWVFELTITHFFNNLNNCILGEVQFVGPSFLDIFKFFVVVVFHTFVLAHLGGKLQDSSSFDNHHLHNRETNNHDTLNQVTHPPRWREGIYTESIEEG